MLDFGIAGKKAVVCASSKGLGFGCADALAATGVNLVMCARTAATLASAAQSIRDRHGVSVDEVACDITTEEGRAAVLDAAGHVDILVNNAGGPPPGDFRDWTRETWIAALDANMLAAFDLIKAVIDPMIDHKFGRIVNIGIALGNMTFHLHANLTGNKFAKFPLILKMIEERSLRYFCCLHQFINADGFD